MAAILIEPTRDKAGSMYAEQFPMWGKGDPIVYWAQGGRVHCRDQRPQTADDRRFNSVHWREMTQRLKMFSQMVVSYRYDAACDAKLWQHERDRAQKFMDDMVKVLQEAKEQCSRSEDEQYVSDRQVAREARAQRGDTTLEQSGLGSDPLTKIALPSGFGF